MKDKKLETRGGAKHHFLEMKVGEQKLLKNRKAGVIRCMIYNRKLYHASDAIFRVNKKGNDVLVTRMF